MVLACLFLAMAVLSMGPALAQSSSQATSADGPWTEAGLSDPSLLRYSEGSLTITEPGTVIENEEIYGRLTIEAPGVIIRNSWIYTEGFWTIWAPAGFLTIENSEIGHPDHLNERGIGGDNIVMRFVEIHHVEDGVKIGSNSTYEGLYIHDLKAPRPDAHTDAIQDDGGAHDSVVRGSYIESEIPGGTSAILIKSDFGLGHDITIENNYLNGGGYTIHVRDGGEGDPYNIIIRNNRFGRDYFYGLFASDNNDNVTLEGNVWDDTGELLDINTQVPVASTMPQGTTSQGGGVSDSSSQAVGSPDSASDGGGIGAWIIVGTLLFALGGVSALAASSFWRRSRTH
ncbi:MAG: right-handed parallel beta-helix repeat-containing protein [Acidimicrobiia bacterium]|nr:right-handed parallel beta-helix repeat-containing protein [Acidimicrobiia bacterium]